LRAIRFIIWTIAWLILFFCVLWAAGALYFDFPIAKLRAFAAIAFVIIIFLTLFFVRGQTRKLLAVVCGFLFVLAWWRFTLKPSNDRPWQPDVAETGWAEINGDEVTIHNVRNCDYRSETDYTPHWETRAVKLSQITGVDLAITYWGSPYMAHPIASFQFADALPICFSIETRKEIGESYSAIGGLYRQYELTYICADERDVIRLRTNYRPGEDVYLYRTLLSPADARQRFVEYLQSLNALHARPRWYNAATTNCTTNIREQHDASKRVPWDWRLLVNGKADEMLFERKMIATGGLDFAELKQRSHVNERAHAADQSSDFSRLIREGLPEPQAEKQIGKNP
jgi:uncharacterized protein DUF4105